MGRVLYQDIANAVLADYMTGDHVQAGTQLPTVRELSMKYGASTNTVMHALNLLELQGLIDRKPGSGCYIKQTRTSNSTNYSGLIGLIVPTRAYEIVLRYYDGVREVCRREGYHVLVGDTNWRYEREREELEHAIAAGCQAVILVPTARTRSQLQDDYLKSEYRDFPIVLLDVAFPDADRPRVIFDNYRVGYDMTKHLITKGHRHIAFMEYNTAEDDYVHFPAQERFRGYRDALRDAGLELRKQDLWKFLHEGNDHEKIQSLLREWNDQNEHVTALLTNEDSAAMLAISTALDMGIDIPGQIEIVGFDNLQAGTMFRPRFTTTNPDNRRAGEIAAEMALQLIRGDVSGPVTYLLPVPLDIREAVRGAEMTGAAKEIADCSVS